MVLIESLEDSGEDSSKENRPISGVNPFVRDGRLTWALQEAQDTESASQVGDRS